MPKGQAWKPRTIQDPQVGDLAEHRSGDLDPRVVVKVERNGRGKSIWLDILGTQAGPFWASDYTYSRKADDGDQKLED